MPVEQVNAPNRVIVRRYRPNPVYRKKTLRWPRSPES